ncbi:C-C motif chemokine 3-like isoform X1 [Athene cunicularia]|uniref:C-C motif chemokine 3-like isoform X1 n=1 Tax=Athene cunicularia TaxID=194338 RepID=UPI000EF643F9|nr:C-C motif chemokine 3-like isoform X1 [Athene cunicularia]
MKVPAATLAILLVMAICSSAHNPLGESSTAVSSKKPVATSCCVKYVSRSIPRANISSAYMTSNTCSLPGVVLVTKKGIQLCADPKAHWVQAHLKHFQALKN